MEHATNPENIQAFKEHKAGMRNPDDYQKDVEQVPTEIQQKDLNERTTKPSPKKEDDKK
jgi:hypothetical protein